MGDEGVAPAELHPLDVAGVGRPVDGDRSGNDVMVVPTEPVQALMLVGVDRHDDVDVVPAAVVIDIGGERQRHRQQRERSERKPHRF